MSPELCRQPGGPAARADSGTDEALLEKIVALLRTLPFGSGAEEGAPAEQPPAELAPGAERVQPLYPPAEGEATAICRNLTTIARAFARLSDEELATVPAEVRERARGELIGVWKILDLVRRLEVSQSLFASGC
jgi:hypothetical protein